MDAEVPNDSAGCVTTQKASAEGSARGDRSSPFDIEHSVKIISSNIESKPPALMRDSSNSPLSSGDPTPKEGEILLQDQKSRDH